ncbi:hypothetical protein ACJ5H2_13345 [Nocardioides sp. R1-1]|uniref:hypothetical protein n=1 Tax=Nocardioides sp. R1-1 TaxID=3383502 RepID=UPI0038D0AF1C
METETKAPPYGAQVIETRGRVSVAAVELVDLQELVQWAYDAHGILAEPSLEREAERAPELDPLQMIHDHVNKAHAQQAENGLPADYLDALAKQPRGFA